MLVVSTFIAPKFKRAYFTCPLCGALAQQNWAQLLRGPKEQASDSLVWLCVCQACRREAYWRFQGPPGQMMWPMVGASDTPPPAPTMPEAAAAIYEEARAVSDASPRAAAALLRVALETLVRTITGRPELELYNGIGLLVREGKLSPDMQQAADLLRLGGNMAAHPGEIRLEDEGGEQLSLFDLANMITEYAIDRPTKLAAMFDRLPTGKREAITRRDTPPM